MELNIISWNVNFIHDNWSNRLININKRLENEIKNTDIICLQEATLPFSNIFTDMYNFLKGTDLKYFPTQESFLEREYFNNLLKTYFPRYKDFIIYIFEKIMDKFLYLISIFYSNYGEILKKIYFEHPFILIILGILCPILFAGQWFFFGMLTIVNKKIPCKLKCKCVGRTIQYLEFKYNNKDLVLVNIHLTPGQTLKKRERRKKEIKKIVETFEKNKNVILCGDFNSKPTSDVIKYLKKIGYKNGCKLVHKKNFATFPTDSPEKCIDFVFIKGDIKIKSFNLFGNDNEPDHKGIKTTLVV